MLTYILFKIQSMLSSATSRQGQPDADLHPVQNQECALVRNKQEQPNADLHPIQNQNMLLSATRRKGQPDADLHPVQYPEHALVSNKQDGPARSCLTYCSKPREHALVSNKQKDQSDGDSQTVQNTEHTSVSIRG